MAGAIDPAARSRARRRALQALYAWQLGGNRIESVIEQFCNEQDMRVADQEYFEILVRGVARQRDELDAAISPFLDRDITRVDPIELSALRIAAWELRERIDVPYRVVLNEAVESTKRFGAEHGHAYVNGVLDKLAAELRAAEYGAGRR
ncbi:transcription antitermination factor NusB [Dokdonella sp.]|uniref:transcription antitermination factor NusB n=1 Tax=Dokdonella sp. TaxID=2291710 RepID=UPI0031C2EB92|nr:transcription antitermination factor NusB [Dokdonella sp.]